LGSVATFTLAEAHGRARKMRRMRKQGRSYREIAEALQRGPVTHMTVMRVLSQGAV